MIEIRINKDLTSDNICKIVKLQCPKTFHKEWQSMLGLHLVLVTLHGRFTN